MAKLLYFFQLKTRDVTYAIPLILPPQSITLIEPFALETTPTSTGGLYAEENGIIKRLLRIEGHPGNKRRILPAASSSAPPALIPLQAQSYYSRSIFVTDSTGEALSGEEHFRYLQDRLFRTYGDLKRQPSTSRTTSMSFHNLKDDEHWVVAPAGFTRARRAGRTTIDAYTIDLEILGKASTASALESPDDAITRPLKMEVTVRRFPETRQLVPRELTTLEAILAKVQGAANDVADAVGFIRDKVDKARAFVAMVQTIVKKIENIVRTIGAAIRDIISFVDKISEFLNGIVDLIKAPFEEIAAIVRRTESMAAELVFSARRLGDLFGRDTDNVIGLFRSIHDSANSFALFKDKYLSSGPRVTAGYVAGAIGAVQGGTAIGRTASALTTQPNADEPGYVGAEEATIASTDTIESLAASRLGDIGRWRDIAVLNGLRPPYISRTRLPGTLAPGDQILIPSLARVDNPEAPPGVLGIDPAAPLPDRLLGTDLAVEADEDGFFDFVVNDAGDDLELASGIANLEQAIILRLAIEEGTDGLYPNIGVVPAIGSRIPAIDAVLRDMLIRDAVAADPRIASIISASTSAGDGDALIADVTATVRGLTDHVVAQARAA